MAGPNDRDRQQNACALQSKVSFSPADGWLPWVTGAYVLLLEREKQLEFVPGPGW